MDGIDLLSVFLERQDIFSDEMILDNLIGFTFVALETTNYAS